MLLPPASSVYPYPPLFRSCHCTLGAGVPLAAAVKLTLPGQIVWLDGLSVINGPLFNVSVAAVVATLLVHALLKRARYRLPSSAEIGRASCRERLSPATSVGV